ncbi:MAG: AarF/ABC1/UbiB kinase family protein [Myxococcales bacterium]|nr:AarF/ABC1/UbiB kinase family protein [Myxococcales bacterium]
MRLTIRLARAWWIFGIIFASYMVQLGLLKLFRRTTVDAASGKETDHVPGWLERRGERVDTRNARRLLRGMLRLRGVYIKLGQVLSIMGGFLPRVYGKELEALQDAVPPHSFDEIGPAIERSLGQPIAALFARVDPVPVAAASLGQVHEAYLDDGTRVAVKVLYPGIRGVVRVDMQVVGLAVRVYKFFVPMDNLEEVHAALVDLLRRETDYRHEAACMERMAASFAHDARLLFPSVIHALSTGDVLTMSFMDGFKITRVDEMERRGIDPEQVARILVETFYEQLFVHRFFHADPHPGNFLIDDALGADEPRVVVLDFGATCEVREQTVDGMVEVLRGFFEQDDRLVMTGIERMGFVAEGGNRALLEQTVKVYFKKILGLEARTAGALMRADRRSLERLADPEVARRELRELMRSFHYPEGWFYVERASVLMFWLVGQIAPDLDTVQIGFPYVLPLLAQKTRAAASDRQTPAPAADGDGDGGGSHAPDATRSPRATTPAPS